MTSVLAYSTSSNSDTYVFSTRYLEHVPTTPAYNEEPDPHCFVCSRHTDHFAEHDDLVDLGLAEYDNKDGSVYVTDAGRASLHMFASLTHAAAYLGDADSIKWLSWAGEQG